jgi:hypothetical protein
MILVMRRFFRRFRARRAMFASGDRVVYVPDGTRATVDRPGNGYSHVFWDDEPAGEFGGSRVANELLRRERE